MAESDNTGAFLAGLAWAPWSEDPSGDCPTVIVQFLESLEIGASVALSTSSQKRELSEWLNSQFAHSHQEKVHWFEVGVHTMTVSGTFSNRAAPGVAEDAVTSYRSVLEKAGVSLETRDRIGSLVRELALTPQDQRIFARLLELLGEQSRIQPTSAILRPGISLWAGASHYMTVVVVIIIALVGFSKGAPPFAFPLVLVAGLLLTTAIGGFRAFRD